MPAAGDTVVVWGNCQAEPLALLLREPLAQHGLTVVPVPAVFLVDEPGLHHVQELVGGSALLISQPVTDNYRIPGCGMSQLAAHLPAGGRLVTYPVTFHVGAFPFQVNAHGGDGERVDAPLTDYHDLRAIVAAERGLDVDEALAWWPAPSTSAVRDVSAASLAELEKRESVLDVATSSLVDAPDALWTMTHPTNALLEQLARRVLDALGLADTVEVPEREFLGARRAPVDAAVAAAHHWPTDVVRTSWRIDGRDVPPAEVVGAALTLYAERPDVVSDSRRRYATRLEQLGL